MKTFDALYDMPTSESVREARQAFDAWWQKHDIPLNTNDLNADLGRKKRTSVALDTLPHRLLWLWRQKDKSGLDLWWKEQGSTLFWEKEAQRPRPEIAYLLSFAVKENAGPLTHWALDKGWQIDVCDISQKRMLPVHRWITHFPGNSNFFDPIFLRLLTPTTVNEQTALGKTPLTLLLAKEAAWSLEFERFLQNVQQILRMGGDVTLSDNEGYTPLHVFVQRVTGDEKLLRTVCQNLLDAGANPLACTSSGATPLALLERNNAPLMRNIIGPLLQQAMCQWEARTLATSMSERETACQKREETLPKRVRL